MASDVSAQRSTTAETPGMPSGTAVPLVTAKALQIAVADLQQTRPGPGLLKLAVCFPPVIALAVVAFLTDSWLVVVGSTLVASFFASVLLITTHDAIHHTLTGWRRFDELCPRFFSWPLNWCHATYSEVHKLHHKMNGDDLADPERVQWTAEEYAAAGALGRFYVRHQWAIDIFVFGGLGLIFETLLQGARFAGKSKSMRRAMASDLGAFVVLNTANYAWAYYYGNALRWLAIWLILERITGAIMQWRAHVEHYGLWGKGRHYFETQNYVCRNIKTHGFASWFFNRLNFHSVHHAFPRVPFYLLKEAHSRFLNLYGASGGESLVEEAGYLASSWRLATAPSLIGPVDAGSASGRRQMLPLAERPR